MCIRGRAYVCTEYTVAPIHRFDYSSILLACSLTRPLCSNLEAFSLSLSLTRKANVQDCFSSRPPFRFLLACNWKATPFASKLCFFRHRFQFFSIFKRYSPRLPFAFTHVICRCSTLINHSPSSRVFVCAYGHGSTITVRGGVSFLRSSRNRMIRFGRSPRVTRFSRRCREAWPPVPTP